METQNQEPGGGLVEALLRAPHRFEFFQAVRLAEQFCAGESVGYDHPPGHEVLRFRSLSSLRFPAGSIAALRRRGDGKTGRPGLEMVVAFMGLTGPAGALPEHYTRLAIERGRDRDVALRDFLDLFNHRLISLFYRAWEKCTLPQAYAKARDRRGIEDLFTKGLYCLIGLGTPGLRRRMKVPDEALLTCAGYFADQHRPAACLPRMLSAYFQVPVALSQLRGHWVELTKTDCSQLPTADQPKGHFSRLGHSAILGGSIWDIQEMFRLHVGPVGYAEFKSWVPDADALRPFCELARAYVGMDFQFDVQVLLWRTERPACCLGGAAGHEPRLGWTAWLLSQPQEGETGACGDAIFFLDDV